MGVGGCAWVFLGRGNRISFVGGLGVGGGGNKSDQAAGRRILGETTGIEGGTGEAVLWKRPGIYDGDPSEVC